MSSVKKTARMAGFLYLIFIITLVFATSVRSKLMVYGDAAAIAAQILAFERLSRISFMSELLST